MAIQKILVVDDSKTELMVLSDLLGKNGYKVRTAENAEEAFRRLSEEKPELILMDVVMPGQNGFQLTRAIARDPQYSDIPIIMCTSKNQETDRVWGMRQGARDYVTKPVNAEELLTKIAPWADPGACRLKNFPKHGQPSVTQRFAGAPCRAADGGADGGGHRVVAGGRGRRSPLPHSAGPVGRNLFLGQPAACAVHQALVCRRGQPAWWPARRC